jgi:hypothetical protein
MNSKSAGEAYNRLLKALTQQDTVEDLFVWVFERIKNE